MEEKQVEEAASSPKRKQKSRRIAVTCQMCGKEKSCQKVHGLLLCTGCTTIISRVKNNPEIIRKVWQQFGPDESLEKPLPMPVPEEIDFDRLMDVIDTLKAIKGVLKDRERKELTPDKEKEIIKLLYKGS